MEFYKKNGRRFLYPAVQTITKNIAEEIYKYGLSNGSSLIIDMNGVENCVNLFFEIFRLVDITLINTSSKILSTIYMTGYDKYIKIFEDIVSLEDNRRELLNRRFCVV